MSNKTPVYKMINKSSTLKKNWFLVCLFGLFCLFCLVFSQHRLADALRQVRCLAPGTDVTHCPVHAAQTWWQPCKGRKQARNVTAASLQMLFLGTH